jgi:conjugative relaxase-like TrwC/TraI family protein
MLRGSKPLTLHQAATYYTREYTRGDYYTGPAGDSPAGDGPPAPAAPTQSPGTWRGTAATELGLHGPVARQDFQELLAGRLRGLQLVAPETATGVHRAAWDFTVSPDKTVSLVALVGGDRRVAAAHLAAAERAFAVLERHAQTKDRARQPITSGNLAAARFDHDASRALDPQLHSHYVVFNLTRRREDGAWRGLESRSLFRVQALATATYHLELARELDALGYDVQVDTRGHVRIAGIPEEARRHFSQRRRQILAELGRQQGQQGGSDPQRAALATRRPKDHGVDRQALGRVWAATAQRLGVDFELLRARAAERLAAGPPVPPADPSREAAGSVAWAVEHLSERQAVFTGRQLETAALRHATGRGPSADQVRAAIAAHPGLVRGAGDRLTTSDARRLEAGNLALMRRARATRSPAIVPAPWHHPGLAPDQLRVARHILESEAQILAVEGKAGTGKTFTLSRVRDAAAGRGWTVRGYAVTTGAVEELRKVGIEAATVKSLERRPPAVASPAGAAAGSPAPPAPPALPASPALPGSRELWILDEAGLLGNRDARTLLIRARAAGARLVLVGDRRQHHAVPAGKPFVDLQRAGLEAVHLDAIRRQQHPDLLAAVRLSAQGRAAAAVELLAARGHLTEIPAAGERHRAMARAFAAAPPDSLMIAPSHAERAALNDLARRLLLAQGRIAPAGVRIDVAVSKRLTGAQRADVRNYRPGDLVTYHRGAPARGLRPGDTARVLAVDPERHLVTVERLHPGAGAATQTYDPRRLRGVDVARVERRELAAGDRIVFRQPLRPPRSPRSPRSPQIANGAAARVTRVEPDGTLEIELDRRPGKPVLLDTRRGPLPIDHGYAVTSHAAQGRTVHTVIATIDVEHPPELVNRQQLNVTISRASHGLQLFTSDRAALPAAVEREAPKPSALELRAAPRRDDHAAPESPDPAAPRARASTAAARPRPGRADPGDHRAGEPAEPGRDPSRGPRPGGRDRPGRAPRAGTPGPDRNPAPRLQRRGGPPQPPDPPRDPRRAPGRGAPGGGGRLPGDRPDPRRPGAQGRPPRDPAGPVPERLKQRLEAAWARWQSSNRERATLAAETKQLQAQIARLRAASPAAPPAAHPVPLRSLVSRLAVLKSRLATLARARSPEELLARTVRQIGVSKALSLLPPAAAPIVLGLRIGTRVLTSLVRDR